MFQVTEHRICPTILQLLLCEGARGHSNRLGPNRPRASHIVRSITDDKNSFWRKLLPMMLLRPAFCMRAEVIPDRRIIGKRPKPKEMIHPIPRQLQPRTLFNVPR